MNLERDCTVQRMKIDEVSNLLLVLYAYCATVHVCLTLDLQVLFANNLCNQYGPRTGQRIWVQINSTLIVFMEQFFLKILTLKTNQQTIKRMHYFPTCKKIVIITIFLWAGPYELNLTLCMLGSFHAFVVVCWLFSTFTFFLKILSGTLSECRKQFGSRSGLKFCQFWSGSKPFLNVINRRQKSLLARKELNILAA